jgi:hypothetical protein
MGGKNENWWSKLAATDNLYDKANRLSIKGLTVKLKLFKNPKMKNSEQFDFWSQIRKTIPIFVNYFTKSMAGRLFYNRRGDLNLIISRRNYLNGCNILWTPIWPPLQPIYLRIDKSNETICG